MGGTKMAMQMRPFASLARSVLGVVCGAWMTSASIALGSALIIVTVIAAVAEFAWHRTPHVGGRDRVLLVGVLIVGLALAGGAGLALFLRERSAAPVQAPEPTPSAAQAEQPTGLVMRPGSKATFRKSSISGFPVGIDNQGDLTGENVTVQQGPTAEQQLHEAQQTIIDLIFGWMNDQKLPARTTKRPTDKWLNERLKSLGKPYRVKRNKDGYEIMPTMGAHPRLTKVVTMLDDAMYELGLWVQDDAPKSDDDRPLTAEEADMIDEAWERHKAAHP